MPHKPRRYGSRDDADPATGPLSPPLSRSTVHAYPDGEALRAVSAGESVGEFYPRYGHPAGRLFESRLARLEEADGAVSFASGLAALQAILLGLLQAGDAVAVSGSIYGGLEAQLEYDLPRFGMEVRRFDPFVAGEPERALEGGVTLVHVETPTNPLCRVIDLSAVAEQAHAAGALLSVDATFLPPPLQRLHRRGADLVMHSATKMMGGHSDVLAGVVSGRHELMQRLEAFRRRTGAVLGPDAAWLLVRSLSTLELRARRASESAARVATWLHEQATGNGAVRAVHYPVLPDHPDRAVAEAQMEGGGSIVTFEVEGGIEGALAVYDRLRTIARAVSLGGTESIASLPVHTSHLHTPVAVRRAAGIADGLIRLSVGLEPAEALIEDLAQALGV